MSRINKTIFSLCLAMSLFSVQAALSHNDNHVKQTTADGSRSQKTETKRGVLAQGTIMLPPKLVYEALRSMRDVDPSGCRVISSNESESIVEETFDDLPIIGKAVCVYRETYDPLRVNFKMISSDKLKAFEGEWTLKPINNGSHTLVSLRSYIETGLRLPFVKKITEMASSKEAKDHIEYLRELAFSKAKQLADANTKKQS